MHGMYSMRWGWEVNSSAGFCYVTIIQTKIHSKGVQTEDICLASSKNEEIDQ